MPGPDDVDRVGVLATIQKMIKAPDGTLRIIAQGIRRIEIERFISEEPYLTATRRATFPTWWCRARNWRRCSATCISVYTAHRPAGALPARRAGAGGRQHRRPRRRWATSSPPP